MSSLSSESGILSAHNMQVPLQKEFKCTIRNSPELMKLVEEFYRAYRALAERYDFATNELYHA
ncbi:putative protein Networked (NET), actin-binding (NAB) [Helianthus annuus]|uniref:NAB domain-containing protein n=1 Tax=Helianthus annuus TaxID=4232 RepID=A0A251SFU2_HELAN|nr:putative protein Networked (NET), actin-binding (NAB) [Helianthus annuus]KAJ0484994.1 putative protein Networked (NET), actin-binding (NAB) [Helianthus annuus]KAJ0655546.1 putative protein Networked (NET), actin-binding (NAB) [Helianthus annuus]KAJ0659231.1 putative protein Networked (NET), actin-binding (NAB) [Helianthus annuus]KAJ0839501.1 putative protein Networked (NET), actin-binding (NAB) [Helianthus annuus]